MPDEQLPITADVSEISPERLIENMTKSGVEEVLGKMESILYIAHREIKAYALASIKAYMWSDDRGRENTIFISREYVGKNHQIHWYKNRKLVAQNMIKMTNQRDFIERCVLREVTPENLTQ